MKNEDCILFNVSILTRDLLCHPQPSGSFQYPSLVAVHQEESVVVAEGLRVLPALPPLTMLLQEASDHCQRRPGTVPSLQRQSDNQKSCTCALLQGNKC